MCTDIILMIQNAITRFEEVSRGDIERLSDILDHITIIGKKIYTTVYPLIKMFMQ